MITVLRGFISPIILGFFITATLVACSNIIDYRVKSSQQLIENCRVVQHNLGKTCIPQHPQRIVALTEDDFANSLALGIKPIATAFEADYTPPHLQDKVEGVESVGKVATPSLEKILRLKPDLILSNDLHSRSIYNQLSYIAPTVVLDLPSNQIPHPSPKKLLEELAYILGKEDVGQKLINEYEQRIKKLQQALGAHRHNMNVSIASDTSQFSPWINGEKHTSSIVLSDVGLQRPPSQRGDFFYIYNISQENISIIDGDVLFFVAWGTKEDLEAVEKLKQKPLWQKLNAVQRNRVYLVSEHWHHANIFAINLILDDLEKYLLNTP
jgi:iron complex transport system substrate-binding protein